MNHDDLERMLAQEEDIIPSSGFTARVMDAVKREAATPPPIPFPWKWALPGFAAAILVLASFIAEVVRQIGNEAAMPAPPVVVATVEAAGKLGVGWIALTVMLALGSVRLSMRLVGGER